MIPLLCAAVFAALACFAASRSTRADVAQGLREPMALRDDYGSNRGWHWPWTPLCQVGFIGTLACLFWATCS